VLSKAETLETRPFSECSVVPFNNSPKLATSACNSTILALISAASFG